MNTYYVAPDGNDCCSGTEHLPWKTIQRAADTLIAGEIVYVRAGVYNEQIKPQNSGTLGKPIVYKAFPYENVVLDGQSILLNGFVIEGLKHLLIEGFETKNFVYRGFYLANSSDIAINKNTIRDWGKFGIEAELGCKRLQIVDNEIVGDPSNQSSMSGIWATELRDSRIYHNYIHDCIGNGIGISNFSHYNEICYNKIFKNGLTSENNLAGISIEVNSNYNIVRANRVFNNHHAGILTNSQYNEFLDNFVHSSADPNGNGGGFYFVNWMDSICSDNVIKNNIIVAAGNDEKTVSIQSIEGRDNIFDFNIHWHVSKPDTYDLISWFGPWPNFETWQRDFNQEPNGLGIINN